MLVDLAKQWVHNVSQIEKLERKNKELEQSNKYTGSKSSDLWKENFKLKSEINSLKSENKVLNSVIDKNNLMLEVKKELIAPTKNIGKKVQSKTWEIGD